METPAPFSPESLGAVPISQSSSEAESEEGKKKRGRHPNELGGGGADPLGKADKKKKNAGIITEGARTEYMGPPGNK